MSERERRPMYYPFLVAVAGLMIAVLLDRAVGTAIFCVAGLYVSVTYVIMALKPKSAAASDRAWNIGVAAVFAAFTYVAANALLG